jgi:hypothetical protein
MSLESALDEEMREVMALLEGRGAAPSRPPRAGSPAVGARAQSPASAASPVRSMLDVAGGPPSIRNASIGGSPTSYGSMLGPAPPKGTRSSSRGPAPTSPPPSARGFPSTSSANPESAYNFEMMPTIEAHSMPKRVTQGGKKKQGRAMSSVYGDASALIAATRDKERHGSLSSFLGSKPKSGSPGPGRSASPGARKLNNNSLNLKPDPGKYVTGSGKVIDMSSAYRRLSDAALLRAGGGLSTLPVRKGSDPVRGETLAPGGGVRLAKDESSGDEAAVESSEDSDASSNGEGWNAEKRRGRRRTRTGDGTEKQGDEQRVAKSLLAAAEDERKSLTVSESNRVFY